MSPPAAPRPVRLAVLAAIAIAVAGCGDSTDSARLSSATATTLHRDVGAVRSAAGSGDRGKAHAALDRFSRSVTREARAGRISGEELTHLRQGIARSRRRIDAEVERRAEPRPVAPTANGHGNGKGKKSHEEGEEEGED